MCLQWILNLRNKLMSHDLLNKQTNIKEEGIEMKWYDELQLPMKNLFT